MKKNIVLSLILTISLTGCNYESTDSKTTKLSTTEDGNLNLSITKSNDSVIYGADNTPLIKANSSLNIQSDGTPANTDITSSVSMDGPDGTSINLQGYVDNILDGQFATVTEDLNAATKEYTTKLLNDSTAMSEALLAKAQEGTDSVTNYVKDWFVQSWEDAKAQNAGTATIDSSTTTATTAN